MPSNSALNVPQPYDFSSKQLHYNNSHIIPQKHSTLKTGGRYNTRVKDRPDQYGAGVTFDILGTKISGLNSNDETPTPLHY